MKKLFNIGMIMALLLQLSSCSKFLDKDPLDQISSGTFWTSQKEVDMALAGVYARILTSTFDYNMMFWDDMGGDLFGWSDVEKLGKGQIEPTSGGIVSSIYSECYQGISSCNFFLENVDRAPISDEVKARYKGEVQFLRAMFYFTLTEFYGGVPLYTKLVTIEESKVKQSTKAEVVTQILADLDAAINSLPNTGYNGHAVKGSAMALKAKVLLHNGKMQEAAQVAGQIITDGKFSLFNNYRTLFLASGQNSNPEIMMSGKYLNPDRSSQGPDIRYAWHGVIEPLKVLVDDYECIDGKSITESPLYEPSNWRLNRDPRLLMTIKGYDDKVVNSAGVTMGFNYNQPSTTGFQVVKGLNWDALPIDYSTKSEQDWVLLRYAEVLMIYAEARNEDTGPDQSVYDAINALRSRPGVNMPDIPTGLTQEQMRERIRHERRVEFGLEGKRYWDIKRWKTAEAYIPTLIDPGGVQRQFDPSKHYLFPFPQSERDINPNLDQNPGYAN
ncbi:MAG: RagB/SusD family nutrient uptake outer membrane protein [Chitinophagaceae bacterium]|nr:RagB/SusD family nutrient uptake outer membrane protein [Chitinophagaceae bacterium]